MKRTIILILLIAILALRWLYPVWRITPSGDMIFSHYYWMRPAVFDAGVDLDYTTTLVHSLVLIAFAYIVHRTRIPRPKPPLVVKQEDLRSR